MDTETRSALVAILAELDAPDAEHRPVWGTSQCRICAPQDGSWPCVTRLVADELRALVEREDDDGWTPNAEHVRPMTTSADLSKLLFEARELVEMWADVVEARAGKPDEWSRRVVVELDAYRASRGWNPHGFGGEDDPRLVIRYEFGLWGDDTRDADMTRLSHALDALEAQGVIRYRVQLGHRQPFPDEAPIDGSGADG